MRTLFCLIISQLVISWASAQTEVTVAGESKATATEEKAQSSAEASGGESKEFLFFKGHKTFIKDPFELRDPFKRDIIKQSIVKAKKSRIGINNVVDIENVPLSQIRITGVLLGKERRAMADVGGKGVVVLKEGMLIGENKAELKAILPGGVVLVEKIRNVYDQDEYLETVIPVLENVSGSPPPRP